jgi:hypothetical protein
MYCNGWSAVVDASKFSYQFSVRKEDQKCLDILHPHTGIIYVYGSLPMGLSSSPSLANRYVSSVLWLLHDTSVIIQGKSYCNTRWKAFAGNQPFNPKLGHGMVLIGDDCLSAALIWAHYDDFLIHGPTCAKCTTTLTAFMDYVVGVGLLYHPGKLTPPSQVVKYTGFLFDTRGVPTLGVTEYKIDKSVAMINYAIAHRNHFSRLGLAVVKGVLESQSEATPSHSGHTHLRSLEDTLHPANWGEDYMVYYSFTSLTDRNVQDLLWYKTIYNRIRAGRAEPMMLESWCHPLGMDLGPALVVLFGIR